MNTLNLRWAVKEPNKPIEERQFVIQYLDDEDRSHQELKLAQKLVGGYVEAVYLAGNVRILCNEDGLANNLLDNCGFVGTLVFINDVWESDAHWGSLTDEQLRKLKILTVLREHMPHPRNGPKLLVGKAVDLALFALQEEADNNEKDWENL